VSKQSETVWHPKFTEEKKMLEQLVESKNNSRETKTRGGFLLTTFMLVAILCFSAVLWSLFAMNVGIGDGELEISSLVAPIAPAQDAPPPPEPVQKQENTSPNAVSETTRQTNTLRLDENPIIPTEISVVPNTQKARPKEPFTITNGAELTKNIPSGRTVNEERKGNGGGLGEGEPKTPVDTEKDDSPEIKKTIVKETKQPTMVSKGVINGQAKSLPKPAYSAAAKLVRAAGEVNVQVTIDESGNVISAKAVSGHNLLRADAEKAARSAKFTPTYLSNQPVKVTGIIIYKFALQ
jgi:protein TonB